MPLDPALVARLHAGSSAARWGVSVAAFTDALERSVGHASGVAAAPADVERYLTSLHLDDLALATACAAGAEPAWDHFVAEYRATIDRAAAAIDRSGGGRELADSLYADLFGLRERDGARQSLFRYFHGRSAIATWLRAVLAQRHVDHVRATARLDPLPDEDSRAPLPLRSSTPVDAVDPAAPERARMLRDALAATMRGVEARDRLRLGLYYVQGMTLAAIGRALGEHEATVSRHLTRSRAEVRRDVGQLLSEQHGLSDAAIEEAVRGLVNDPGTLDAAELIGATPPGKIRGEHRSTE